MPAATAVVTPHRAVEASRHRDIVTMILRERSDAQIPPHRDSAFPLTIGIAAFSDLNRHGAA